MELKATPGTILKHGFRTFAKEWWQLLILAVITLIPSFLLTLTSPTIGVQSSASYYVFSILSGLFSMMFLIVLGKVVYNRFFENKHTKAVEMFGFIKDKFVPMLLTFLLLGLTYLVVGIVALIPIALVGLLFYGLYTLVGTSNVATLLVSGFGSVIVLLLLVAAFVILITHLMFTPYVVLFEGTNYLAAIKRSYRMVKQRFWNILGNWLVLMLVLIGITFIVSLIVMPILMATGQAASMMMLMTLLQQYATIPVTIGIIALFFAVKQGSDHSVSKTRSKTETTRVRAGKRTKTSATGKKVAKESSASKKTKTSSAKKKSRTKTTTSSKSSKKKSSSSKKKN